MVTLYCGDCLEKMKCLADKSVDLILCDLPYNMTSMGWDCLIDFDALWEEYNRVLSPGGVVALFSAGIFTVDLIASNRKMFKYKLIWHKNVPTGMSSAKYRPMKYYEEICIFSNGKSTYNPIMKDRVGVGKSCYNYDHYCNPNSHINLKKQPKKYDPNLVQPSDVLSFKVVPNRKGKLHPTQKPVELLEYLILTYSNEGDTILDNCMGSGSTGVACVNTSRNFVGIELNDKYFDIAKTRILDAEQSAEVRKEVLF